MLAYIFLSKYSTHTLKTIKLNKKHNRLIIAHLNHKFRVDKCCTNIYLIFWSVSVYLLLKKFWIKLMISKKWRDINNNIQTQNNLCQRSRDILKFYIWLAQEQYVTSSCKTQITELVHFDSYLKLQFHWKDIFTKDIFKCFLLKFSEYLFLRKVLSN